MKILVMSDSHGKNDDVKQVIEQVGPVDMMIHLGDIERGDSYILSIAKCPPEQVHMVAGNNDYNLELPSQKEVMIAGKKALITHGHRFYVNGGISHLKEYAVANKYDIVMYGHTHVPFLTTEDGITILNPGSVSYPRQEGRKQTFLVIDVDKDGNFHYNHTEVRSTFKEIYKLKSK